MIVPHQVPCGVRLAVSREAFVGVRVCGPPRHHQPLDLRPAQARAALCACKCARAHGAACRSACNRLAANQWRYVRPCVDISCADCGALRFP